MNPKGVSTGAYGDRNCADEMLWASAELWRTTRETVYQTYFVDHHAAMLDKAGTPPAWPMVAPLAMWTYVLSGTNDTTAKSIQAEMVKGANAVTDRAASNGYCIPMTNRDYVWGSNSVVANYGMQLLVANAIAPDQRYVNTALDNLHYLLGRNTHSLSFLTQVGTNYIRHPHHRPSGAQGGEPWPGLLSGGPNRSKQDPAMRKLPDLPPAKMFLDDQESYASNEIAINWNAPLVFLFAGALPQ